MNHHPPKPTRLTIVLHIDEPDPLLLLLWTAARATQLTDELWNNGINANIANITIDDIPTHPCQPIPAKPCQPILKQRDR